MPIADRYDLHLSAARDDIPTLDVFCRDCVTPVFGWKSTLTFSMNAMTTVVANHENIWHSDKQV